MNEIDEKYRVPVKQISCPGCGHKYGHDDTGVDINSEECSKCALKYEDKRLVSAEEFIETVLGYTPLQ